MNQIEEQTHFEFMEEQGQINMFELIETEPAAAKEEPFQIGDKVTCIVSEESDPLSYNYFKYYHPYVLTSVGEIIELVQGNYQVRFKHETLLMKAHELQL